MLKNIPQKRALFYLLVLGALPLLFVIISFQAKKNFQDGLSRTLSQACLQKTEQNGRELFNRVTKKAFATSDPFYLNKEVETFQLLSRETEELKKLSACSFQSDERGIQRRMSFLSGPDNSISFAASPERRFSNCREIIFSLAHPVEVDLPDLQSLLTKIEGVSIKGNPPPQTRPHLIVAQLSFEKKEGFLHESYLVNLQLIQREYGK